jgi:hypothetical protein
MRTAFRSALILALLAHGSWATAAPITTNEIDMQQPPAWLKASRVEKVVSHIQDFLEWDIRKIPVFWYSDQGSFEAAHHLGPYPMAFSRRSDLTVHLGPRVDASNFDSTFGHELVHIILYQKYKDAVPPWLDEGLANYVSKHGHVDYPYLAKQPPGDVHLLTHPFKGPEADGSVDVARFHYQASTALMEMIASKCDLHDLLQLSVGKSLEGYLSTFCGISDVNDEFRKWVKRKAR